MREKRCLISVDSKGRLKKILSKPPVYHFWKEKTMEARIKKTALFVFDTLLVAAAVYVFFIRG